MTLGSSVLPVLMAACLVGLHPSPASAASDDLAVVRAVLFYSPACPHCHQVMTEDLPPLQERYGGRLDIRMLDVTTQPGADLYEQAVTTLAIPDERIGVPTLVVGDVVLVGSAEIPGHFPGLVAQLLGSGGSAWPAIPGLSAVVADPADSGQAPEAHADETALAVALDRAARDPLGSAFAIALLIGLVGVLVRSVSLVWRVRLASSAPPSQLIPWIALLGLVVAGYLALVETSGSAAVCGPIGDCNRVHESEWARLFGTVPIAVLGLLGYLSILATWLAGHLAGGTLARPANVGLIALAAAGAAFSVYLTFLEPFVIGATCAWCLASAVLMGALLVLSAPPARAARPLREPALASSRRGRRVGRAR